VESLVGSMDVKGDDDTLNGETGNDRLEGDSDVLVSAVVQGALIDGFATPTGSTSSPPTRDVVRFDTLVQDLEVRSGIDMLTGGLGDDTLTGDNALRLAAVVAGDGGAGSPLAPAVKTNVTFGALVDDLDVTGGADALFGLEGADDLVGDHTFSAGVILTGAQPNDGVSIVVERFAQSIDLGGANDWLEGGLGDDRLVGDNEARMAGVRLQDGAGSRTITINRLIPDLDLGAGRDTLLGGDDTDTLTGDQEAMLAGAVIDGGMNGVVSITVSSLLDDVTFSAERDTLDGGSGDDRLVGDHAFVSSAVLDARGAPPAAGAGSLALAVTEAAHYVDLRAADDTLYGGAGNDAMLGDSQLGVSAWWGSFATPAFASAALTGTELIDRIDVRAGKDYMRGGAGNDQLVGDSDTTVALRGGGSGGGLGSAMTRLIDKLSVSAGSDNINGEAGTNHTEQGNRAIAPSSLVKSASISSKSATGIPAAPVIEWNARLGAGALERASSPAWLEDFVNQAARNANNPNAEIRIQL
jgi:Ca2+-binding RTX toxin-like protein